MPCPGKCFIYRSLSTHNEPMGKLRHTNWTPLQAQPKMGGVCSCVQEAWMQNLCCHSPNHTASQASATGVPGIHRLWEGLCVCVCVHADLSTWSLCFMHGGNWILRFSFSLYSSVPFWNWFCQLGFISSLGQNSSVEESHLPFESGLGVFPFALSHFCLKLESGALMQDDHSSTFRNLPGSFASSYICSREQSQASLDMNLHVEHASSWAK